MNALVLALRKHVNREGERLEEYRQLLLPHLIHCKITRAYGHVRFDVIDPHRGFYSDPISLSLTYTPPSQFVLNFAHHYYGVCETGITQIKIESPSAQSPDCDVSISTKCWFREAVYHLTVRSDYAEMGFAKTKPLIYRFPNDYDPKIKETFMQYLEDIGYTYTST